MRLRNGEHGYGVMTKTLHWLTVVAVAAQFAVGLAMGAGDAAADLERERIEQFEELVEGQGKAAEEFFDSEIRRFEDQLDARDDSFVAAFTDPGLSLPEVHVLLGLSILLLGLMRVLWRSSTPLPPWAPYLGAAERRLQAGLEKALLTMLFAVPLTGVALIVVGGDWLPLHITAQLVLLVAIALHVGLVVKHTFLRRDGQLRRML